MALYKSDSFSSENINAAKMMQSAKIACFESIGLKKFEINSETTTLDASSSGGVNAFKYDYYVCEIPDSVTTISDYCFLSRPYLSISELNNVKTIGNYAFMDCSDLFLDRLPSDLTSINSYAFYNCRYLMLSELPSTLEYIGASAFAYCGLLSISELPPNLKYINKGVFSYCYSMKNLKKIPAAVTEIYGYCFDYVGITTLTFEGTPTFVDSYAFSNNSELTTINVPWAEGAVANAPWGATNATINYNYKG